MLKRIFPLLFLGLLLNSIVLYLGFAVDDIPQIVKFSLIHNLGNIPKLFLGSIYLPHSFGIFGVFYKPVFFSIFSILYFIGGGSSFVFHLTQLFLYVSNSILVYILFSEKIKPKIALYFSLLFLFHPVNETIVAYISDLQEALFLFFGILALLIFIKKPLSKIKNYFLTAVLILFSLLSKETGILFVLMVLLYAQFFDKKNLKKGFFAIFFSVIIYLILRTISLQHHLVSLVSSPVLHLNLLSRINLIPQIFVYYFKQLFLFSFDTATLQLLQSASISEKILSWVFFIIFIISVSFLIHHHYKKKEEWKLFFLVWFLLGLILHSQLIPLEVIAAKRWLYFPIVGLLGYIALLIEDFNYYIPKRKLNIIKLLAVLVLFGCIIYTLKLHLEWFEWQKYISAI